MTSPDGRVRELARRWVLALVWLALPFVAGPAFADALDPRSPAFRAVASTGLWLVWAVVLGAALVPRTASLTLVRVAVPAALVAAIWAAVATPSRGVDDGFALVATAVATVVAFAPAVGDEFVNGSAYGHERRLPLRAPGPLLLGPIELTWALVIVGAAAGPLLLACGVWIPGAAALVVGWAAVWFGARSLHVLARRWVVFTPAGVVLHDQLVVVEAMLVLRRQVASLGPAAADSTATDLTVGAPGLALELVTTEPLPISRTPARRPGQRATVVSEDVEAVLFTPTRPGVVLREALERRLPVA